MNLKKTLVSIRKNLTEKRDSIFGNQDYEKYIVITRSRTGSNLLISLLDSHPYILGGGELFRRLNNHTCAEVWNKIFISKPKKIKFLGFKLFYYHPMDSEDKGVWDIIKNDKSIKIIHLTRQNMLRTIVSREIADKTNTWTNKKTKNIEKSQKQIELDLKHCLSEFDLIKDYEDKTRMEFTDHDIIEISYEKLVKDKQTAMNELFDFFGVFRSEVSSSYKKQNVEKLEDLVTNYDEIRNGLVDTKWAYLIQ